MRMGVGWLMITIILCIHKTILAQNIQCHHGSLNIVSSRMVLEFTYSPTDGGLCVDYESDDSLSIFVSNQTSKQRLEQRMDVMQNDWIASWKKYLDSLWLNCKGDDPSNGKTTCRLIFSPYVTFCFRFCSKAHMSLPIQFKEEPIWNDPDTWMLIGVGLGLLVGARLLSENRMMMYVTGGGIGCVFAASILVLLVLTMTTRESPTRHHMTVAALFQFGVLYFKKQLQSILTLYLDWMILLLCVAAVASMLMVHYFITRDPEKNQRFIRDVLFVLFKLGGSMLVTQPIPSTLVRLVVIIGILLLEWRYNHHTSSSSIQSSKTFLNEEEYQRQGIEYTKQEINKLVSSKGGGMRSKEEDVFIKWLQQNHSRIVLAPLTTTDSDDD